MLKKCGSRYEIPLCKPCLKESKKKKCIKCNENMPKYSRDTYCSMKCENSDMYCLCGNKNMRRRFPTALGFWTPTCRQCFYKNKANNYKKPP